jgi:hypothetical protein
MVVVVTAGLVVVVTAGLVVVVTAGLVVVVTAGLVVVVVARIVVVVVARTDVVVVAGRWVVAVVVATDVVAAIVVPVVGEAACEPTVAAGVAAGATEAVRLGVVGVTTLLMVTGWSTVTGTPAGSVTTLPSEDRTTTTRVMVSSSVAGVIDLVPVSPRPKTCTPPIAAKHTVPIPSVVAAATAVASAFRRSMMSYVLVSRATEDRRGSISAALPTQRHRS